jgi:hypothetical protein
VTTLHKPEPLESADDRLGRRLTYAAWGAALLLFLPQVVVLLAGRIFALDDLSSFHVPMRYLYQRALAAHHSLLWTSQLFSGFYMHAEGQVGAFHPLHLLLYTALPLSVAFNVELILSYVFAFAGMCLWLRRSGLSLASSLVGAIAFAFSGFALLHMPHLNAIAVIAHVPWLLMGIDVTMSDAPGKRRKGFVSVALLCGSQALLGYPQYMWMSALICLVYGLACWGGLLRRLMLAGTAAVAGVMLGGIQLLPSLDLLATSVRKNVGSDFSLSYSLHPLNLIQLFSPYALLNRVYAPPHERQMHEFGVYSGAFAAVALCWTIARYRELPVRRLALFAIVTGSVGLLLALGRYGGVYEWLVAVPLLGKFRAPARYIMLLHLGLAVLSAVMVEDILRLCLSRIWSRSRQTWLWVPVLISAGIAAASWLWPQRGQALTDSPLFAVGSAMGVLILGATTLVISDAAKGSRSALLLLPWVFAIDLGVWGYSYVLTAGISTVGEVAASAAPPPSATAGATVHQAARIAQLNALVLNDFRVLRPYVGLIPPRRLTLSTNDELRVSGAQWLSTGAGWTRVADPMPRVRLVYDWKVVGDAGGLSGIDIRRTALVTTTLPVPAASKGTVNLVLDAPGRIVVDVAVDGPALLVTTEAYDRGWRAAGRSGTALHTLPVYADFLGILVQPGSDRITATFEPESMRRGVVMSLSGAILIAVMAGFLSRKK